MRSGGSRYCPLCEETTDAEVCPNDGAWTIPPSEPEAADGGTMEHASLIAGKYIVKRKLGRGSMGTVYLAEELQGGRVVAVKTLLPDLTAKLTLVKRFFREAQAARNLEHDNVVKVFDFGVDESTQQPYIGMEFLDGHPLSQVLAAGALPERRAAALLAQVAEALVVAHARKIVHRDLKPDNIHVQRRADGTEHVKVLDFGIAKLLEEESGSMAALTTSGALIGTPLYMSPEQSLGKPVTPAADLYAVGCLLHHALTGGPPFVADDVVQVMVKQVSAPAPPLPETLADGQPPSPALVRLHAALLAKDIADRPADAGVVARVLGALAVGQPAPELVTARAAAAGAAAGLVAPAEETAPPAPTAAPPEIEVRGERPAHGSEVVATNAPAAAVQAASVGGRASWLLPALIALVVAATTIVILTLVDL